MSKVVGAPAQHSQPSRKGKKAWRKNVDILNIEQALEEIRDQERMVGEAVHKKTDDQLFQIDITGDQNLKRTLPKFDRSQLMSSKILAQRSALPSLYSRSSRRAPATKLTPEEKTRLLRIGKRKVKGPFNSYVDATQLGAGSAILEPSEAVKSSGQYNVWDTTPAPSSILKGKFTDPEDFLLPYVTKPAIKPPKSTHFKDSIEVHAIPDPHQGTSYNPLESAHRELLLTAHEIEVRRVAESVKLEELKQKMEAVRQIAVTETGPGGMKVDTNDESFGNDEGIEDVIIPATKPPPRKTQKQKRKAAELLSQKRALLDEKRRRRFLATISSARRLRSQVASSLQRRQATLEARRKARLDHLKQRGLVGQRLGKHRVPEGEIDVQLGEELVESLRELKPQGNLFRDRFLSMQQRALVEPRVPVLPKRRRTKIKEYEKHAWKRFDRE